MTLKTRLSKLEASVSPDDIRPWLRVIGNSQEECEARRRALIDAGQALATDNFAFQIIVTPRAVTCVALTKASTQSNATREAGHAAIS